MQLQYLLTPYWYTWFIRFYEDSQLLGLTQSTFILLRFWGLYTCNCKFEMGFKSVGMMMSIQNTIGHPISELGTLLSFEDLKKCVINMRLWATKVLD